MAFPSFSKVLTFVSILLIPASLTGCSSLKYLFQAGKGQLALLNHAKPIPEVIKDPRTPPRVKDLLSEVAPVKKFGEENGLKPTSSYQDYVKLDRMAAVWVVSACEPLKFKSKEWEFPIVGTFPFLGWFDLEDAQEFANELKQEKWDVDFRGARAYSTLGWFRDSVLSTMLSQDSGDSENNEALGDLVNVILHESVHATLYIKGQSYFNESLASFVADRLTKTYIVKTRGEQSPLLSAYLKELKRSAAIEKEMHQAYGELSKVYDSDEPDSEKLTKKKKRLTELQTKLHFRREINNATLIQFKTYNTGEEYFSMFLKRCNGDWDDFLRLLGNLDSNSFSKTQEEDFGPVIEERLHGLKCEPKLK